MDGLGNGLECACKASALPAPRLVGPCRKLSENICWQQRARLATDLRPLTRPAPPMPNKKNSNNTPADGREWRWRWAVGSDWVVQTADGRRAGGRASGRGGPEKGANWMAEPACNVNYHLLQPDSGRCRLFVDIGRGLPKGPCKEAPGPTWAVRVSPGRPPFPPSGNHCDPRTRHPGQAPRRGLGKVLNQTSVKF